MPEVKVEVVPVGIKYLCDSCGNGYMSRQEIDSSFLYKTLQNIATFAITVEWKRI